MVTHLSNQADESRLASCLVWAIVVREVKMILFTYLIRRLSLVNETNLWRM